MPVTINGTTGISTPGISSTAASSFSAASTFSEDLTLAGAGVQILNNSGRIVVGQAGSVIQVVNVQTQSLVTGSVAIPTDDTIPQNTEGTELFTLAITPTSASSKLFIHVNTLCGNTPGQWPTIALFQDSTANALNVNSSFMATSSAGLTLSLAYFMTAGTTSSTTFKIRFGLGNTGAMQINGFNSRVYGGVATATMTIMEIAA
jgi:hypothetical protein